jgi:hypothetical protein
VVRRLLSLELDPRRPATERLKLLGIARDYGRQAVVRDPKSPDGHRLLARIDQERAATLAETGDRVERFGALDSAAAHWDAAIARYPSNVRDRLAAAEVRMDLWRTRGRPADAAIGLEHLATALTVDALRETEQTAKLSAAERARVGELQRLLTEPPN